VTLQINKIFDPLGAIVHHTRDLRPFRTASLGFDRREASKGLGFRQARKIAQ
jgi:hypothetical protein